MADLRALRTFAAVARQRSFTRAAQELYVSQQAVSRTVAALEAELGTPLLRRTTRAVEPTPAGERLLEDAERILADVELALDRARAAGRGDTGAIRIATTPAIESVEIGGMVDALRADVPDAEVSVDVIRPRRIAPELVRDEVDVVVGRALAPSAEVETRALGATPAGIAVPAAHRLAARQRVGLADLDGERVVVWSRRSAYTTLLLDVFERAGVRIVPVVSAVVGGDGLADVAAGAGIALVPAAAAPRAEVRLLALDEPVTLPVHAAWRRWGARPIVGRFVAAAERALAARDAARSQH